MLLGDQKLNLVDVIDGCNTYHIAHGFNMNKDSNVHQIYFVKSN